MSKLPILLSLLLLIIFLRKTCSKKGWRLLIKTVFADSAYSKTNCYHLVLYLNLLFDQQVCVLILELQVKKLRGMFSKVL